MTTDTAALHRTESHLSGEAVSRLLVTWQHPIDRGHAAVGLLTCSERGYTFVYLRGAATTPGFRPFLGFPDLDHPYTSPHLFPIFDERVLGPSRPDRPGLLDALALGSDAGPMEFLARSGGHRHGDTIELLPLPSIVGGTASVTFLVHGIQHQDGAHLRIDSLQRGDELALVAEPENLADPMALLVTSDGQPLGWVPHPLLDFVHVLRRVGAPRVTVVRANGRQFGNNLRLLVRLEGAVPSGCEPLWD